MISLADVPPSACMMAQLIPSCAACAEIEGDDALAFLYPEERAQIEGAVESRIREFATSRSCARHALRRLGIAETAILRGSDRMPQWPPGIVGSITHCEGFRAAAVARQSDLLSLGIDAEIHNTLPPEVREHVCNRSEISWLARAPGGICWDRVIFSAKESIFKAWFPLVRGWLGFEDLELTIDPIEGTFHARLLVDSPLIDTGFLTHVSGSFLVRKGFVLAATAVRRSDVEPAG